MDHSHPLHRICGAILLPSASEAEEDEQEGQQCRSTGHVSGRTHTSERVSRREMIRHDVDFLQDDPSTMTFSRRIALHLMKQYAWYNPRLNEKEERDESSQYIEMDDISSVGSFNRSMLRSPIQKERPSLDRAWAYFEHVTLPRYLDHNTAIHGTDETRSHCKRGFVGQLRRSLRRLIRGDEDVMDLAEPGEDTYPTKLYSPLWTPMNQMGDFGLGVGLCTSIPCS